MKYCEQCGTEVQDDNKFCSKCGAKCESDDIESSKKGRFLSGKKKKILLSGSGVLLAVLLIAGTASGFFSDIKKGYDEVGKEENDNTTPALSMEDFLKKYNETYQSAIKLEAFLIRGENDGFVVRDKDDLFADYTNYIHYYYNNGATEDSNNKEAVERATMVQLTGNQKIFEVLVGNENKIKAVEVTLKDGDFATAQNFMKIFIPSSREEDYPDLRNKAREDSVAYMYKNGVVVKVAENMIRIWYDTKENFETVSKQPFLSEKEEKQIIQNSVGVWEQESYSDLPILDISMPSDKALLITQYYSQGTDEYGNENYLKKECEVDVNEKEYADFTKDIEYTIKDYDNKDVTLRFVLRNKELDFLQYITEDNEVMYTKTDKNLSESVGEEPITSDTSGISEPSSSNTMDNNKVEDLVRNFQGFSGVWGDFGVHADPYQGMIEQAIKSKIRLSDYFGGDVNEVSLDVSVFQWDGVNVVGAGCILTFEGPSPGNGKFRTLTGVVNVVFHPLINSTFWRAMYQQLFLLIHQCHQDCISNGTQSVLHLFLQNICRYDS